jgi:hypothetical protein
MLSTKYMDIIVLGIYIYVMLFQVSSEDCSTMIILTLLTALIILQIHANKKKQIEGFGISEGGENGSLVQVYCAVPNVDSSGYLYEPSATVAECSDAGGMLVTTTDSTDLSFTETVGSEITGASLYTFPSDQYTDTTSNNTIYTITDGVIEQVDAAAPEPEPEPEPAPAPVAEVTPCLVDQKVEGGVCVACPVGETRAAGDDPTGANTSCYSECSDAPTQGQCNGIFSSDPSRSCTWDSTEQTCGDMEEQVEVKKKRAANFETLIASIRKDEKKKEAEIDTTVDIHKEQMNVKGSYDGLCLFGKEQMNKVSHELIDNSEIDVFLGVQGPLRSIPSDDSELVGPNIDGQETSPQKLSVFANNKASLECCTESPYHTSQGCLCLTDNQKQFLRSRGSNSGGGSFI